MNFDAYWQLDIPKAPPLGLLLDQIHYDSYNRKFGEDGMHEAIDWSEFQVTDKFLSVLNADFMVVFDWIFF